MRAFITKQNRYRGGAGWGTARPLSHQGLASPRIDGIQTLHREIGNQAVWRLLQLDVAGRPGPMGSPVALPASGSPDPVVQRAALKGHTTAEKVDDSIAAAIDKALAESPTIAKFVDAKALKAEKGHLEVDDPAVFAERYRKYAKAVGATDKPENVGGFTDRKTGKIHLKFHTADVEAALHEAVHLNSSEQFQKNFGHPWNEGVTEYFTQKILEEQKLKPGKAYPDQLKMANALIEAFGEKKVGDAYFKGELAVWQAVVKALGSEFKSWHQLIHSEEPKDWEKAAAQLKSVLTK